LRIVYSEHLKRRLAIRLIPIELPEIIFNEYDEKYFDYETGNFVLIKKVEFLQKPRDMMIVYEEGHDKVEIITIHPLKKFQKENRIKTGRWKRI
jgi:hypothetical protein